MTIKRGYDGSVCLVFKHEENCAKWDWVFYHILRRRVVCFGGFLNAFELWR